jgi:CRISPR system Cascade subunit CasE
VTPYLSRLILDPRARAVQRDLADCQAMHIRVMAAFDRLTQGGTEAAPADARARHGVLYRVDARERDVALLVQSMSRPDWSRLPPEYLATDFFGDDVVMVKALGPILAQLSSCTELRFRLRANPTRCIDSKSAPDGTRRIGKRVPVRGDAAQAAWLQRKGADLGFEILELADSGEGGGGAASQLVGSGHDTAHGWRSGGGGEQSRRLTLEGVTFDGRLRVTDLDAFRKALVDGVGRGKAYGFGLLSIAPS